MEHQQRSAVIAEAQSWLGTPFHHQACIKGVGVGCGTILNAVYSSVGIPVPTMEEIGHFPPDWHLHTREERYLTILEKYARRVDRPQPGDIALFKLARVYAHSAIVVEWPHRVIHAWKPLVSFVDATQLPLSGRKPVFLSPWA